MFSNLFILFIKYRLHIMYNEYSHIGHNEYRNKQFFITTLVI